MILLSKSERALELRQYADQKKSEGKAAVRPHAIMWKEK